MLTIGAVSVQAEDDVFFGLIKSESVSELAEILNTKPDSILRQTNNEAKDKPIHLAAQQCSIPLLQLFIDAKADVNAKNYYQHTPFFASISKLFRRCVEISY